MKKIISTLLVLTIILLAIAVSNPQNENKNVCNIDDPIGRGSISLVKQG